VSERKIESERERHTHRERERERDVYAKERKRLKKIDG
jgi:hypothetical protein